MSHATQETPALKKNDASGAFDTTVQKDEESTSSSALLHVLDNDPCGHFAYCRAPPLPPRSPCPRILIIKTEYGVKAELTSDGSKVFAITTNESHETASSDFSQLQPGRRTPESNLVTTPRPPKTRDRYRYRLLPDWQTSYLWYDVTWPGNPQDSPAIEFDEIKERYPELFPFYTEWQELQEEVFAQHFSEDLERREGGVLNTAQLLAWEVDGFLIACWLVFQDNVSAVEYKPGDVAYLLERKNLEGCFQEFMRDRIHLT